MTDYEQGFAAGERDAWRGRNQPLPKPPEIIGDKMRGYWDARLPRNPGWNRHFRITPAWWDAQASRYVSPLGDAPAPRWVDGYLSSREAA